MDGPRRVCGQFHVNEILENPTRCGNILFKEKNTCKLRQVKTSFPMGQSAGDRFYTGIRSMRTYKSLPNKNCFPSLQRLNVGHPDGFVNWLIGVVDADGTFWFNQRKKGSWDFRFKVGLRNYNIKLLCYLKKKLCCGSITYAGKDCSQYRIGHPALLHFFLIPLFSSTAFYTTSKQWDYMCFKDALEIYMTYENFPDLKTERDQKLLHIKKKQQDIPKDFIVLHQKKVNTFSPKGRSISILTPGWILGFTEAEGSFYLTQKSQTRIVHGIGWAQKTDKELLKSLRKFFHIGAVVKPHSKFEHVWVLDSTARCSVETCIKFFEGKLKGIKAHECKIWARSYRKYKGNFLKLLHIQHKIRNQHQFHKKLKK